MMPRWSVSRRNWTGVGGFRSWLLLGMSCGITQPFFTFLLVFLRVIVEPIRFRAGLSPSPIIDRRLRSGMGMPSNRLNLFSLHALSS
ncbi:hypothetical protein PMAYCL1PPCAC_16218, partial [Pristionchus mayeri]